MPEIAVKLTQRDATTTCEAAIRQHQVAIDRPQAKGGSDAGPMGGELLLASLGGCFLSNLISAARAREIEAAGMTVEVVGDLDGSPPRFQRIRIAVTAPAVERPELEKLVLIAERSCIVANTLKGAVELVISAA